MTEDFRFKSSRGCVPTFPSLGGSAWSSQKPVQVIDAISNFYAPVMAQYIVGRICWVMNRPAAFREEGRSILADLLVVAPMRSSLDKNTEQTN